jgi:hypothetical protein
VSAEAAVLALPAPDSPPPRARRSSKSSLGDAKRLRCVRAPTLLPTAPLVVALTASSAAAAAAAASQLSGSRGSSSRGDENEDPFAATAALQALVDSLEKPAPPSRPPVDLFARPANSLSRRSPHNVGSFTGTKPNCLIPAAEANEPAVDTRAPPPLPLPLPPPPLRERNQPAAARPYHPPKLPPPTPPATSLAQVLDRLLAPGTTRLPPHAPSHNPSHDPSHNPPASAVCSSTALAHDSPTPAGSPHAARGPTPPSQQPRRHRSARNSYVAAAHALPPAAPSQATPPKAARPRSAAPTLSPKSPTLRSPKAAAKARSPSAKPHSPRQPNAGGDQLQWTTHRMHRHFTAPSSPRVARAAAPAHEDAPSFEDEENPCDVSMTGLQAATALTYRASPPALAAAASAAALAARHAAATSTAWASLQRSSSTAGTEAEEVEANIARALFSSSSRSTSECGDAADAAGSSLPLPPGGTCWSPTPPHLGEEEEAQAVLARAIARLSLRGGEERGAASDAGGGFELAAEAGRSACVLRWVDYSSKYGLGYLLSDGAVGVVFNDHTTLLQHAAAAEAARGEEAGGEVEYRERDRGGAAASSGRWVAAEAEALQCFAAPAAPVALRKKMAILAHFRACLRKGGRGLCGGVEAGSGAGAVLAGAGPTLYVKRWLKTPHAMVFRLSNKTIQVRESVHTRNPPSPSPSPDALVLAAGVQQR